MNSPSQRDALHRTDEDPTPHARHRLAGSAGGTSGTVGNPERRRGHDPHGDPDDRVSTAEILATLRAAVEGLFGRSVRGRTPEEVRQWSAQAAAMRRDVVDLADAYERALLEERAGEVLARRIERMVRPHEKRLEQERRRTEGGMYVGEKRSPNRPTQVEVDPAAWAVVKARAVRSRKTVAAVVGTLVAQSLDGSVQLPVQTCTESRPSAPGAGPRPSPERRFARLFIDDEAWLRFRERAVELDISTARLIGLVIENEARVRGWRP